MPDTTSSRIRQAREAQHLQQQALAKCVGLSPSGLSQIECDRCEPKALHLKCLAQALGVSADYLLGLRETPNP